MHANIFYDTTMDSNLIELTSSVQLIISGFVVIFFLDSLKSFVL
jgi:hypothetical protein